MTKFILLTITFLFTLACAEELEVENNTQSQEFSCEKSKKEIDTEIERSKTGDVQNSEYWELRQIEYNEKCQDIYTIA